MPKIAALAITMLIAWSLEASAEPELGVRESSRMSMRMRAQVAAADDASHRGTGTTVIANPALAGDPDDSISDTQLARKLDEARNPQRSLRESVIFRFNIGFGLDGGQLNCSGPSDMEVCARPPSGVDPAEFASQHYQRLRTYAFGDAVIGTRGLVAQSLSTYLAARFRLDERGLKATAVPSIQDSDAVDDVLIRSAYAETDGFFTRPKLKPIFVRAGRQFRYGPAVSHFDGITLGYDSRAFSTGLFFGTRVSLYGFDDSKYVGNNGIMSGIDARFDLYELRKVPLVLNGAFLFFDDTSQFEGGLTVRWSKDILVRGTAKILRESFARQRLQVRARISRVTTVMAEVESRSSQDWPYDLILSMPSEPYGPTDPRRYLNFGLQVPRVYLNLRAGTVWFDNIDVLLRAAASIDRDRSLGDAISDSASYAEAGGALEVRVRRAVGLGAAFLARGYARKPPGREPDVTGMPGELPEAIGLIGERSFMEGGFTVRYDQGKRTFSASAEAYGRVYHLQSRFLTLDQEKFELRSGSRFSVQGWANKRVRMRIEYDVAFAPKNLAPEIRGMKSLRILTEGTF